MSGGVRRRKAAGCEGIACEHTLGQQPLELYGYLWQKVDCLAVGSISADEAIPGSGDKFSFALTDTVVFKYQKPVMWVFTSLQEKGVILRKTKKHLSVNVVLQEFQTPKATPQNRQPQASEDEVLASFAYLERVSASSEPRMIIEHLNKAALEEVLLDREKPPLSILQRYIPTRSGYNHCYEAVYTPEDCMLRRCINPHSVNDYNVEMAQRTATFEVGERQFRHRSTTDKALKETIEGICGEICTHLEKIVGRDCAKLVTYFKIGANRRVYLLWSSMISFESTGKPIAKHYKLALPNTRRMNEDNNSLCDAIQVSARPISQTKPCPNCSRLLPRSDVDFLVSFKSIINMAQGQDPEKVAEPCVPTLILAAAGPTTIERFNELKEQTSYLYRTVKICQACANFINASSKQAKSPPRKADLVDQSLKVESTKQPSCKNAHDLFWARSERERKLKSAPRPVVVVSRAVPPGRTRLLFSKANTKSASTPYRRYLSQTLPRLRSAPFQTMDDHSSLLDSVRSLAYWLKQKYGRPSLRFALAQTGTCLLNGSIIKVVALQTLCGNQLLSPVVQHWRHVCSSSLVANGDDSLVDIDELDAILTETIIVKTIECSSAVDANSLNHTGSAGKPEVAHVQVARPPRRPKSAAATIPSERPGRRLINNYQGGTPASPSTNSRAAQRAVESGSALYGVDVHMLLAQIAVVEGKASKDGGSSSRSELPSNQET